MIKISNCGHASHSMTPKQLLIITLETSKSL